MPLCCSKDRKITFLHVLLGPKIKVIHLVIFSETDRALLFSLLPGKCHINYGEDLCLMESAVFNGECSIRGVSDW